VSEENLRKLQKLVDSLKDENKDAGTKLKLAELQLKMREQEFLGIATSKDKTAKELTDAKSVIATLTKERDQWKEKGLASNAALGTLTLEKDKLNRRVIDLQAEVDQRFAGIPLTGENVVFLIDISGSMTMMDENTDDPEKWPFLCETLMKLMRSIPTLQRFQVILFSEKTSYLFGSRDSWFKYEGPETAKVTRDALKKVKVEGGTNMHDAFEEAFRYRKIKLDTIYLFSDGLPNVGAGVPATILTPTEAQKNLHMSKYIRDKLKSEWNRSEAGQKGVRINAVGFFFESPDVGAFLWALAREHRGAFVGLR
jgi:von Willebrand factor type A domain